MTAVGCDRLSSKKAADLPIDRDRTQDVPGYARGVSAERDELRRLVEQLSDDRLPAVLAEARRQSGSVPAGEWPPPWFGSFASGRSDLGSDHEDLLAEGFGRS
jgi:hypothetical protein